jgi:hypothetical protein
MSTHALVGLAGLNALCLVCGLAALWLVRGFATLAEAARLAGLGYFLGVAVVGAVWTLWLVAGLPFALWTVLAVPLSMTAGLGVAARRHGRRRPTWRLPVADRSTIVAAVGIAAAGVVLEAFFRVARLSGLYEWDGWSFWIPKGKAIYFFGDLDVGFFTSLPGSSYPPLVPVLDAAAFHAMGSADVVTLHVQYWLFGVGFVWALAGLLAERVPAWILWPFVLLVLVAPRIGRRFFVTEADLFLDCLFVLAAILVAYWLLDGDRWLLVTATGLMGAMVLTKREGMLLAALLVACALLTSAREWRHAWPRLGLAAAAIAAVAAPWRIWYVRHGTAGEGPTGGIFTLDNVDRLWPSVRLAFDVLFSSAYWSVTVPVAVGALALAIVARAYRPAIFFGSLLLLVTLGGGWITWVIPELPITHDPAANPIVRYTGAAALLGVAAAPLLLALAWGRATSEPEERAS